MNYHTAESEEKEKIHAKTSTIRANSNEMSRFFYKNAIIYAILLIFS
jgi:hypothetical protein